MARHWKAVRAGALKPVGSFHPAKAVADRMFHQACPLSASARLVANAIAHLLHTDKAGGRWSAWIYQSTLAKHTGLSVTTVKKALKEIQREMPDIFSMFLPSKAERPVIKGVEFAGYRFTWIEDPQRYDAKRQELEAWKRDVLPELAREMTNAYASVLVSYVSSGDLDEETAKTHCRRIREDAYRFLERAIVVMARDRLVSELRSYDYKHLQAGPDLQWHPELPEELRADRAPVEHQ